MPVRVKVNFIGEDGFHWVQERNICLPSGTLFSVAQTVPVKWKGASYDAKILEIEEEDAFPEAQSEVQQSDCFQGESLTVWHCHATTPH